MAEITLVTYTLTIRFLFESMSSPGTILPCNRTIRNGFGQQAVNLQN